MFSSPNSILHKLNKYQQKYYPETLLTKRRMEEVFWGKHLKSTAPLLQLMDSKCTQSLGKVLCKCSDSKQKPVRFTYRCCCFSCSGSRSRWQTIGEVLHPIEEPFLYTK